MKPYQLSLILSAGIFALLGCGGGGGMVASNIVNSKTAKIIAADAYVVALPDEANLTLSNGKVYKTTKVEANGTIVFENIPKDTNLNGAIVSIPSTAIVDTDGDGNLSAADQTIRMPLSVQYDENATNIVANPITTIALENNDSVTLKKMRHFDPVKAKLELTLEYNETLAKIVAINDAIADAVKDAKENNQSIKEVIKSVDTNELENVINNASVDVNTTLKTVLKNVDEKAIQKAIKVVELAKEINQLVKTKKIDPHEGIVALIAVSDANVSVNTAKTALQEGNITQIINSLPKNKEVETYIKKRKQTQNNENNSTQPNNEIKPDIENNLTPPTIPLNNNNLTPPEITKGE